jgi:hypothetical protein
MAESLLAIKMHFCQFMDPEPMQALVCRIEAEATIARESRVRQFFEYQAKI